MPTSESGLLNRYQNLCLDRRKKKQLSHTIYEKVAVAGSSKRERNLAAESRRINKQVVAVDIFGVTHLGWRPGNNYDYQDPPG